MPTCACSGGTEPAERSTAAAGDLTAPMHKIATALDKIPNNGDRDDWQKMGHAVHGATAGEGFDLFDKWSRGHASYNEADTERLWDGLKPNGIGAPYIFKRAYDTGVEPPDPVDTSKYPITPEMIAQAQQQEAAEPDDGGPRVINTAAAYDNHGVTAKWTTYADDDGDDVDDTLAELAPRWIEKHVVTYLEGPGGLGKSMVALQDAACLAAGHEILGEAVEQAGVLYLNYEEPDKEFARRRARIRRHFGITKGGDFQALHLKNEPAGHILRVTKDGALILTRFGREFHAKLAERRDRGLHTFVVFDGIMDAVLFEGSTRVEDTIARQVIAMLDRWCETYDFTAYAILHPSRAAERQGGGSYAPAWSTKPRVIHTFDRVTLDGKAAKKETPRSQCFTRRLVLKRSHGEDQYHVDMWFRDGCFEPLPTHANGGGEDPVDVAVDLACRQAKAGRVQRNGTMGGVKLTPKHAIIINYRRRVGKMVGPDHFLASLAEGETAGRVNYQNASGNRHKPAGYYPVDGWVPIDEDGIPYVVDVVASHGLAGLA
jgi:hypothetical protein